MVLDFSELGTKRQSVNLRFDSNLRRFNRNSRINDGNEFSRAVDVQTGREGTCKSDPVGFVTAVACRMTTHQRDFYDMGDLTLVSNSRIRLRIRSLVPSAQERPFVDGLLWKHDIPIEGT